MNANFTVVKSAVDDNNTRITELENALATLQSAISTLQAQISTVNNSSVMALEPYLSVDTLSDSRGPLLRFTGVNLQLVNGTGSAITPNGLGNLIIGYDSARNDTTYFCSDGTYADQTTCVGGGGTWAVSHKGGSHYLVMGDMNNYSQYGGIVAGVFNTSTGALSSVLGGNHNTARGVNSTISAGNYNIASGMLSSVSGGKNNTASGNTSSVSGGIGNTASNFYSSVSGGSGNTASAYYSSVSGGSTRSATAAYNWVAGTLLQSQ